jgi:hypothetical protein
MNYVEKRVAWTPQVEDGVLQIQLNFDLAMVIEETKHGIIIG